MLHMIGIDLRRGLRNKQFWIAVMVLETIFLAVIVSENILSVQQYYYDGTANHEWLGFLLDAQLEFENITRMDFFVNFFPLLGALAYACSIVDDRKHAYYQQITQKNGIKKYYWSRLISSGLMGGILVVILLGILILMLELGITHNPLLKDAVEYYKPFINDSFYTITWGGKELGTVENPVIMRTMVCAGYFLLGTLYGVMAALIAFVTDNRVLVYAVPVILSMIYERGLYAVILLSHKNPVVEGTLRGFMLRERMGCYENLNDYCVIFFLIIFLVVIGKMIEQKVVMRYMEGGCEE